MIGQQWMVGRRQAERVSVEGVYPTEAKALDHCPANNDYFVQPVTVVRYLPESEQVSHDTPRRLP